MENTLKTWMNSFIHLLFPPCCVACSSPLVEEEEMLCTRCNMDMPRTNYHLCEDNPVERMFWGKFPLERATSYFFYRKGSDFRRILHELKYGGKKQLGTTMGRFIAAELSQSSFFQGYGSHRTRTFTSTQTKSSRLQSNGIYCSGNIGYLKDTHGD